jgi:glyoxylase-like metal-dependent hydrolase (beta-lactamase superfamily II)
MKIIPLSEGSFTIDKTKVFISFDHTKHKLEDRNKGSLLVEIQPFLVITKNDIILLDTGLGFQNEDGLLQIHQNLLNNGIEPNQVTKILLSHLHKDHAGGLSYKTKASKKSSLSFPNAAIYVSEQEFHYAFKKGLSSYDTEQLESLQASPNLMLLQDEHGNITPEITYRISGGHCPYHTTFIITEDNVVFFGGDVSPQMQQMKSRFVAKYDYDGKKSMELRTKWWEEGQNKNWTFLFYHDIKTPIFKR